MNKIPDSHEDLLRDETKAYAYLATLMADGTPQVTPIWFNSMGESILINSARGRTKDRNMRARPSVAILIADPRYPLRYMQIRGHISNTTEEGALDHISALSQKYRGRPWDPVEGQIRVIYSLLPDHVSVA